MAGSAWPSSPRVGSCCPGAQAACCWARIFIAFASLILFPPGYRRPEAAACVGTAEGTHRCEELLVGLGTQPRVSTWRAGRGKRQTAAPPWRAACAKSSVVRPGETRGFPTNSWCPSCSGCGRGEVGVGGQGPVSVSSPPWQSRSVVSAAIRKG